MVLGPPFIQSKMHARLRCAFLAASSAKVDDKPLLVRAQKEDRDGGQAYTQRLFTLGFDPE